MKETPIIMSGSHPKLILDGIKTQTRRVIKFPVMPNIKDSDWHAPFLMVMGKWCFTARFGMAMRQCHIKCPYGQVGDRLWVRETWHPMTHFIGKDIALILYKDGERERLECSDEQWDKAYYYSKAGAYSWRPSIHMPRWASRITLEITDLCAEMLRSISLADAMAEGGYTVEEFIKVYLKINHLPDDANPWNWAIKYKLLDMGQELPKGTD